MIRSASLIRVYRVKPFHQIVEELALGIGDLLLEGSEVHNGHSISLIRGLMVERFDLALPRLCLRKSCPDIPNPDAISTSFWMEKSFHPSCHHLDSLDEIVDFLFEPIAHIGIDFVIHWAFKKQDLHDLGVLGNPSVFLRAWSRFMASGESFISTLWKRGALADWMVIFAKLPSGFWSVPDTSEIDVDLIVKIRAST
jgi:hypothetical protein